MENYRKVMSRLEALKNERGEMARLSIEAGLADNLISRWVTGDRSPKWEKLARVLDAMGAQVVFPGDNIAGNSLVTPEATAIDKQIRLLRESGSSEEAIRQFAISQLDAEFAKRTDSAGSTSRAGAHKKEGRKAG